MSIDHRSFAIRPRTIQGAGPEMTYDEIREDWELAAGMATIATLSAAWGDVAADAFDCWMFGA